jgi:PAS domain S-box-containing protein/putative nucleotidyltransferase with HDIG domain
MTNREKFKIGLLKSLSKVLSFLSSKKRNNLSRNINDASKKALEESEEKYRLLVETIVEGILILDFMGQALFANKALADMLGFDTPEECIGKNVFDFIAPDHKKQASKDLSRVNKGEWGFTVNYKVLKRNREPFWVEVLGRSMTYEGRNAGLMVVRDITERKQMEEEIRSAKQSLEIKVKERTLELKSSLEKGERLLKETVEALSTAVEAKDPYTAGHQKSVAKLACAIAAEMGFTREQVDGMHMSAIIHDIGKIHIPAEILTKPGKLSEAETQLINTHAQYGYDILHGIEFPWPISEIILQHHERINGSGYPSGLSGDKICLEAKVLAVADTVESMATDRPYRTSLGLKKALKEISNKQGILYDSDIVAICLKLFNKKGFKFNN